MEFISDTLDNAVQDSSLLLNSPNSSNTLRSLGQCMGVPPLIVARLWGSQDLFQDLLTPPLHAPAPPVARLLPHPEDVAHMHRAVVTK